MTRDPDLYGSDDTVRRLLHDADLWFIVGLGDNPLRPAYGVARLLQQHGKRIVPIHPAAKPVHGVTAYPSIEAAAAALGAPDVVDVFMNPERAGRAADEAIAAGAGAVWFQLEIVDEAAAQRVRAAGIDMVMDRCPAIEWPRLGPV